MKNNFRTFRDQRLRKKKGAKCNEDAVIIAYQRMFKTNQEKRTTTLAAPETIEKDAQVGKSSRK